MRGAIRFAKLEDLAVGASRGSAAERLWILFLDEDVGILGTNTIASGAAGSENFGRGLLALGDADLDGVPDLAVGSPDLNGVSGGKVLRVR